MMNNAEKHFGIKLELTTVILYTSHFWMVKILDYEFYLPKNSHLNVKINILVSSKILFVLLFNCPISYWLASQRQQ